MPNYARQFSHKQPIRSPEPAIKIKNIFINIKTLHHNYIEEKFNKSISFHLEYIKYYLYTHKRVNEYTGQPQKETQLQNLKEAKKKKEHKRIQLIFPFACGFKFEEEGN